MKPLGDPVLDQPLEEKEVKKGGIIIPNTAKEKPQEGTVVAGGTGKLDDNGKKIEFNVRVGKIKGGAGIYPKIKLQELANGNRPSKYRFTSRHFAARN